MSCVVRNRCSFDFFHIGCVGRGLFSIDCPLHVSSDKRHLSKKRLKRIFSLRIGADQKIMCKRIGVKAKRKKSTKQSMQGLIFLSKWTYVLFFAFVLVAVTDCFFFAIPLLHFCSLSPQTKRIAKLFFPLSPSLLCSVCLFTHIMHVECDAMLCVASNFICTHLLYCMCVNWIELNLKRIYSAIEDKAESTISEDGKKESFESL